MKVMVTGSRHLGACRCAIDAIAVAEHAKHPYQCPDYRAAWRLIAGAFRKHGLLWSSSVERTLLHGNAPGADTIAAAIWRGAMVGPIVAFPADWASLGRRAGPERNRQMVRMMPDLCLAFPLPGSIGTHDAARQARRAGIRTCVYELPGAALGDQPS